MSQRGSLIAFMGSFHATESPRSLRRKGSRLLKPQEGIWSDQLLLVANFGWSVWLLKPLPPKNNNSILKIIVARPVDLLALLLLLLLPLLLALSVLLLLPVLIIRSVQLSVGLSISPQCVVLKLQRYTTRTD